MPTLDQMFAARVRAHPDAEALRLVPAQDASGGKGAKADKPLAVTWAELDKRARALAVGLLGLARQGTTGLPPAARVAILSGSRLEWVLADLACVMAGLVSVPLFPNVEPKTLERVLLASDSQVVIAENPWQAKKLLDVVRALPAAPHLVLIDEVMTLASGASASLDELGPRGTTPTTLAELERRGHGRELPPRGDGGAGGDGGDGDACWTICYTPGTEGQPKGVMWTHDNLGALTAKLGSALLPPDKPGREPEVQLLATPLAQALPRAMLWAALTGAEVVPGQRLVTALARSEQSAFEDAKLLRPTIMIGVPSTYERARGEVLRQLQEGGAIPAMVARWAQEPSAGEPTLGERVRLGIAERVVKPALTRRFGGRCRLFIAGGAPLGEGVQSFYHRFQIPLRECYGLVETAALTHVDSDATPTLGTVGKPLPGVEQRLGDDGELLLRGPQVSPGYWRDPAETSKVFDPDGWFATGDLARIDEQGRVFITDRKREIIVLSNGRTLAPRPIEAALREEPLVSNALVHGERRDFATALIALDRAELERLAQAEGIGHLDYEALTRHPAVHARIGALVQRVNQHLPPHAAIKKHAVLSAELSTEAGTLTPTQVPRRARIAERYKSLLDSFYAESF